MSDSEAPQAATVRTRNIGGISEWRVRPDPGVTALIDRNATNRTSFLQALMGACGSDAISLKDDADEGSAELELDGRTYARLLSRENGTVSTDGMPHLRDAVTVDRFAFLLGLNETRRAVIVEYDLYDAITSLVDADAIETKIKRLQSRRARVERRLNSLDSLNTDWRSLELEHDDLEAETEALEVERDDIKAEIKAEDRMIGTRREHQAESDEVLSELQSVWSDLESVRFRLQSERESAGSLREEYSELQPELDSFDAEAVDRGEASD